MTPGRLAMEHRQAAREFVGAQLIARKAHCPIQEQVFHASAIYHMRETCVGVGKARQLAAARNLRLGGSAGRVPAGYHGDSQTAPAARL